MKWLAVCVLAAWFGLLTIRRRLGMGRLAKTLIGSREHRAISIFGLEGWPSGLRQRS